MRTLITGYQSDLSQAFLRRRKQFGDEVIMTTSSPAPESHEAPCKIVPFDLARPETSAADLEDEIAKGVDCLILNAASRMPHLLPLHEWPFQDLCEYLRTNIEGNIWLVRRVLPEMMKMKSGRILFISSLSSTSGTSNYGIYCSAKAAMEGFIFNISVDYAEFGIYSNILRPGILATSRTKEFWSRPGYQRVVGKTIPAGVIGTPDQVAEASDVLLSQSSYINGSVLDVSGGLPRIKQRGPW